MDLRKRHVPKILSDAAAEINAAEENIADFVRTLTWEQIEHWQKDNEYIRSGYRRAQNNWKGCFESVFGYIHNETVNIHSHLFGALVFLVLLFLNSPLVLSRFPTTTWKDAAMFSVFLMSAVYCLLSSSFYHMSECHSEHVAKRCNALDYAGIVVLIVGSFFPAVYYAFYCDPLYQSVYLSAICLCGLGAAYIVLNPEYAKPSHRSARAKVFVALGLSAIFPVTHAVFSHGLEKVRLETGFYYLVSSGALYICGAALYANRIPERLSPGTFDYFFSSHQIFHVMVVLAALAHYVSVLTDIAYWHGRLNGVCAARSFQKYCRDI